MIEAGKNKDCHDIRASVLAFFLLIEIRLGVMSCQSLHCRKQHFCKRFCTQDPGVK